MKTKAKQLYQALIEYLSSRNVGIIVSILFLLSLLPVIYVGLHNYASGDDYWFGVNTYRGLVETGSLWGAIKGSFATVADFYENWQGTWFTLFLFTLSPNHFVEQGYIITVFISLGLLIGSVSYLAHFYLIKKLNFSRGATAAIVCMVLYIAVQYIPRTTSGLYWFNGVMHYSVPFFLAVTAVINTHKFIETKKISSFVVLFICFSLLGGGSYQAPMVAALIVFFMLVCQIQVEKFDYENKKIKCTFNKKNLWIVLAIIAELIGLVISFMAPGNSVRGGEEFGFDLKWIFQCIIYAIDRGIYLGVDYFTENPVTTVIYLMLALIIWQQLWRRDRKKVRFGLPLIFVIYMNGIYWAAYTPEIYARSDVSGGVPNTYFHIFLLITLANIVYVHGWLQEKLEQYWEKKARESGADIMDLKENSIFCGMKYKKILLFPGMVLGVAAVLLLSVGSELKTTNAYCIEYVQSGKMAQYVEIREEQHRILSEEEDKDAVIPEVGDQYPLLHMPLSDDRNMSRNMDRARYYNKDSVTAVKVD